MELKIYTYILADVILIVSSLIYGMKFLKKRNYLLAGELLVETFSATNLLLNAETDAPLDQNSSLFCDAFSRCFGMPVISIAGLMALTHGYKPSKGTDFAFFVAGIAVTVMVWTADFMVGIKPYFYLVLWSVFSLYFAYFGKRLLDVGEKFHASAVFLALVSAQVIASIYDFYHLPGDDDHMIFYIFALLAWSQLSVTMYYAYCALERAQENELRLDRAHVFSGLQRHF